MLRNSKSRLRKWWWLRWKDACLDGAGCSSAVQKSQPSCEVSDVSRRGVQSHWPNFLNVNGHQDWRDQRWSYYRRIAELRYQCGAFPGIWGMLGAMTAWACYDLKNVKAVGFDVLCNRPKVAAYRAPSRLWLHLESRAPSICWQRN